MTEKKDHDVRLNRVGIKSRTRLTCYTCNGATLIHQPYMSFEQWEKACSDFLAHHLCSKIKNEGFRG